MVTRSNGSAGSRVLILSNQSLFHLGIQNLLEKATMLDVVDCEVEAAQLLAHIKASQPGVIILDADQPPAGLTERLMVILHEVPGIRLVGLSYQHNELCIFRGETKEIRDVADLLRAVEQVVS